MKTMKKNDDRKLVFSAKYQLSLFCMCQCRKEGQEDVLRKKNELWPSIRKENAGHIKYKTEQIQKIKIKLTLTLLSSYQEP